MTSNKYKQALNWLHKLSLILKLLNIFRKVCVTKKRASVKNRCYDPNPPRSLIG